MKPIYIPRSPNHIENEQAYENAKIARIKANARKTRARVWRETHPDAQRLSDWLNGYGEFGSRFSCGLPSSDYAQHNCDNMDRCCDKGALEHPLVRGMFAGDFGQLLAKMADSLTEWGGLTDKQTELVRKSLARAEERLAKAAERRAERLAADRATSTHVGTVGERRDFTLTVQKVFEFDGQFGMTFINICKDAAGNVIVYKGSSGWDDGETLTVKATVKAHDERDGIAQTLISRPKII